MKDLTKAIRAIFAWEVYRDTGVWRYSENKVTGKRCAVKVSRNGQPLMLDWLRDGDTVVDHRGPVVIGSNEWNARW